MNVTHCKFYSRCLVYARKIIRLFFNLFDLNLKALCMVCAELSKTETKWNVIILGKWDSRFCAVQPEHIIGQSQNANHKVWSMFFFGQHSFVSCMRFTFIIQIFCGRLSETHEKSVSRWLAFVFHRICGFHTQKKVHIFILYMIANVVNIYPTHHHTNRG